MLIVNEDKALLIDTGYKRHFHKVQQELTLRNLKLFTVVVSHFHPDHIGGLSKLSNVVIYGNKNANITLEKFQTKYDHLLPTIEINDKTEISFGNHFILMEPNKGHSIDGLLITVDDKYLCVGDDLIYTDNGESVLPFCADHNIENHISSLKLIDDKFEGKVIIPSHGVVTSDDVFMKKDIKNRIDYLDYIRQKRNCTFEEFKNDTGISFFGEESHLYNTK